MAGSAYNNHYMKVPLLALMISASQGNKERKKRLGGPLVFVHGGITALTGCSFLIHRLGQPQLKPWAF